MFNKKRIIVFFIFILLMFFLMTFAGTPIQNASVATRQVIFTDGYNGKDISTQTVEVGKDAVVPNAPYHKGYAFAGWFRYEDHEVRVKDFTNILHDLHVIALYGRDANNNGIPDEDDTYFTVTFVNNRTNEVLKTQSVLIGMNATAPKAPTIAGYKFVGWDKKFTNVRSNLTVNTIYKKNGGNTDETIYTLIINYVYEDGSKAADSYTKTANYANRNYKVTSPEIEGYTPDKAVVTGTIGSDGNKDKVETVTYSAVTGLTYKVKHYKENVEKTGYDLAETESLTGSYNEYVTAKAKTYEGFTFDNTITGTVESGNVKLDGSLVLELYYKRNTHTVVVDPKCNPDEEVCEVIEDPNQPFGKDYTLPVLARKYILTYSEPNVPTSDQLGTDTFEATLKGYCKNSTTCADSELIKAGATVTVEDQDVTYNAVWDESGLTKKVQQGANYTTDTYDYTFSYWLDVDQVINAAEDITLAADKTLEAQYTREGHPYTLTITYKYENGNEAAETYTDTVKYEETYTVESPTIVGYTPNTATVTGSMPAENKTVDVVYTANNDNKYTIETYVMKEDLTTYEMTSEEKTDGVTDEVKEITPDTKEGFTLNTDKSVLSGKVTATEPFLVLKVYYDRNTHTVIVDPKCNPEEEVCEVIEDPDQPFGKDYTLPVLARKYILTYSEPNVPTSDQLGTDTFEATLKGYCKNSTTCADSELIPAGTKVTVEDEDVTYNAVWDETGLTKKVQQGANYTTETYDYTFAYWLDVDQVINAAEQITLTADKTIEAQYTREGHPYTLTITYKYENGNEAADTYTDTVKYGETYTVDSPTITGYTPNTATVTGSMPAENKTVEVTYTANNDNKYTIETYVMKEDLATYEMTSEEKTDGVTDEVKEITPDTKEGFTLNTDKSVLSGKVTATEPFLVLKVYYDRNTHDITIDPNCNPEEEVCTIIEDPDQPFGKDYTLPVLERKYTLTYKEADELENNTTTDTKEMTLEGYCKNATTCADSELIPAGTTVNVEDADATYTAIWSGSLDVTIKDGRNYQTATDNYTFNKWSKYTVGETVTLTQSETITAEYIGLPRAYTLTINYKYTDGTLAAAQYTDEVVNGTNYSVQSPTANKAGYSTTTTVVEGTMPTEDVTVDVTYTADTNTVYYVDHYKENENKDGYDLFETTTHEGTTDTDVTATPNEYEGFTFNPNVTGTHQTDKVKGDGTLRLSLYYDRNTHDVTIDPNCNPEEEVCEIIENPDQPFGKEITLPDLPRSYTLTYEEADELENNITTDSKAMTLEGYCKNTSTCTGDALIPAGTKVNVEDNDTFYVAVWSGSLDVTIKDGRNYQTATDVYTFTNWSKYTVGETVTLTKDETIIANYSSVTRKYTLTINYVYNDGSIAAAQYTDEVENGTNYSVPSPTANKAGYSTTTTVVEGTMPTEDVTVTVTYTADTDTTYYVDHYKENEDKTGFDLFETETKHGTTDTEGTATPKDYEGFTFDASVEGTKQSDIITGNGQMRLSLYYTRDTHTIIINPDCDPSETVCTIIEDPDQPFGTEYTLPALERAYTLTYKEANELENNVTTDDFAAILKGYCKNATTCADSELIPAGTKVTVGVTDDTYTAVWNEAGLTKEVKSGRDYQTSTYDYTFSHWLDGSNEVLAGNDITLHANKTLEAQYTHEGHPYKLTVTYKYENGTQAHEDYVDNAVKYGTTYNVTSPEIPGYTPSTEVVTGTMPAENKTVEVTYTANEGTKYTVKFYKNSTLEEDAYVYVEEIERSGKTDTTAELDKDELRARYTGYTLNESKSEFSGKIAGDGSLVLNVYYDINEYTIKVTYRYEDNSHAATEYTETKLHGETYSINTQPVTGYHANKSVVSGTATSDVNEEVIYSPDTDTAYTIETYVMNLDGTTYEKTTTTGNGTTNEPVSVTPEAKEGFTVNTTKSHLEDIIAADGTTVLTVYYDRNSYNLTYSYKSGTTPKAPALPQGSTNLYGATVNVSDALELAGYTFDGWYNGSEKVTTATIVMPAADVDLTATFTANTTTKYHVKTYVMDLDGEYQLESNEEKQGTTDETVTLNPTTREGFTLNTTKSHLSDTVTANEEMVLEVYYDRNTHKVTYSYTGESNTLYPTLPEEATYYYGATVNVHAAMELAGYTFDGWYNGTNKVTTATITMPDTDVALTGSFSANTDTAYRVEHYKQNIENDEYTLAEGRDETGTTGVTVSESAKNYEGFTFDSTVEGTLTSSPIAGDGSTILKLYYTRNTHKVTYTYTNTVDGAPSLPGEATYKYGAQVSVQGTPNVAGYTFNGWKNGENVVTSFNMPDEDVRLTGEFVANTNTAYKVEHYWQNIENDEYTLHETENLTGTTGTTVNANIKSYTGFVHNTNNNDVLTDTINGNGNTTLKVYYDRETYTVTWKNGNTTLETDTGVKYGSKPSYDSATPTKADTHVTTGGDWTYNNMFGRWMNGTTELTSSTIVTGNVTYTAEFYHLEPEVNAGKQLEFEKNSNVSEVREVITVNVVYDGGDVKESNVSGYTLEGFDSSEYTANKPNVTSEELITKYNGLYNTKLRYKIVLNAGTSKFEVEMSVPSANNNGKYEYIATKNRNCTNNCDQLSNTSYVEKRELDHKFLELTERYNSLVTVKNVYIKYKNGTTVKATLYSNNNNLNLDNHTVVRYDYKYTSHGNTYYHLPTRLAQMTAWDLRGAYYRSNSKTVSYGNQFPEGAITAEGERRTGTCYSGSCTYYLLTENGTEDYNASRTYYRYDETADRYYKINGPEVIDVESSELGLVIDEVIITYTREASVADNEAAGTFKVTYAYIGGDFVVKSEEETTTTTVSGASDYLVFKDSSRSAKRSMKVETPVEEEIETIEPEEKINIEETKVEPTLENNVIEEKKETVEVPETKVEEVTPTETETKEEPKEVKEEVVAPEAAAPSETTLKKETVEVPEVKEVEKAPEVEKEVEVKREVKSTPKVEKVEEVKDETPASEIEE